jgi:hypothetical protein
MRVCGKVLWQEAGSRYCFVDGCMASSPKEWVLNTFEDGSVFLVEDDHVIVASELLHATGTADTKAVVDTVIGEWNENSTVLDKYNRDIRARCHRLCSGDDNERIRRAADGFSRKSTKDNSMEYSLHSGKKLLG